MRLQLRDGRISGQLAIAEVAMLRLVDDLLASVGEASGDPAAARLTPDIFPGDADRSAEFRRLSEGLIGDARAVDLAVVEGSLPDESMGIDLSVSEAESWIRAITSARLVLGARLGIEEDGWEDDIDFDHPPPQVVALFVLGHLQEDLVMALQGSLPREPQADPEAS